MKDYKTCLENNQSQSMDKKWYSEYFLITKLEIIEIKHKQILFQGIIDKKW